MSELKNINKDESVSKNLLEIIKKKNLYSENLLNLIENLLKFDKLLRPDFR